MYYILEEAAGTKETGPEYPQAQEMIEPYDYDATDSIYITSYYDGKELPCPPNLRTIKVESRAKLTDVLSVAMLSASGMLISKRLQLLLQDFLLVNHRFYPATIEYKGTQYGDMYVYLHLISDLRDCVDYERSVFFSSVTGYDIDLRFKSKEGTLVYYEAVDKHHTLKSKHIAFLPSFGDYDLFYISNFNKNIYISKKLHDHLLTNKVTGASFLLADDIVTK
jgi:hypothetical protein